MEDRAQLQIVLHGLEGCDVDPARLPVGGSTPEDRKTYALERASLAEDLGPFQTFMHRRLDATLGEYVRALQEALP